ncbi:MAG: hypothetical protein RQ985_08865 [Dehalococcoidia bacterium]|jgi:hypothetical protein|nr:hypothetical protein [Dehalococcoidia bacterium]
MTKEQELINAAIKAGEDGLTALGFALDRLVEAMEARDEADMVVAVHTAGKGLYEAQEALQAIMGVLRELQRSRKETRGPKLRLEAD